MAIKNLLIVYHSKTGKTQRLANAVYEGANDQSLETVSVTMKTAAEAGPQDLVESDGLLLGTPENFGYMSGAMKDFFDRTFYEVEGKIQSLPYSTFISAGNDGSGALRAIRRIANGYPFQEVQEPVVVVGDPTPDDFIRCKELGLALGAGIDADIF